MSWQPVTEDDRLFVQKWEAESISRRMVCAAVEAARAGQVATAGELVAHLAGTFKLELLEYDSGRLAAFALDVMTCYGRG